MSDEFGMDAVDRLAAQLFVQRLGAWVLTGRQDRIRDNEISAAATNAYQGDNSVVPFTWDAA